MPAPNSSCDRWIIAGERRDRGGQSSCSTIRRVRRDDDGVFAAHSATAIANSARIQTVRGARSRRRRTSPRGRSSAAIRIAASSREAKLASSPRRWGSVHNDSSRRRRCVGRSHRPQPWMREPNGPAAQRWDCAVPRAVFERSRLRRQRRRRGANALRRGPSGRTSPCANASRCNPLPVTGRANVDCLAGSIVDQRIGWN